MEGGNLHFTATLDPKGVESGVGKIEKAMSELQKSISRTSDEIEMMKDEMNKAAKAGDAKTYDELARSINDAQRSLADQNRRLERYQELMSKAKAETKSTDSATVSLRTRVRELREELVRMEDAGLDNTKEYREMAVAAAKLQDQMSDMQATITHLASDTMYLDEVMSAANFGSGLFSVLEGAMETFGIESENVEEAQKRLQAAMAITTGMQSVQMSVQKQSGLMQAIYRVQTLATAKAKDLETAATVRATVAQKVFNLVAKSNPYVLLATAVISVVGGIALLTSAFGKNKKAMKEMEDSNKAFAESMNSSVANANKEISVMDSLIAMANDTSKSYKQRQNAVKELNSKYPSLNASLKGEKSQLSINTKAYEDYRTAIVNAARAKAYEERLTEAETKKLKAEQDKIKADKEVKEKETNLAVAMARQANNNTAYSSSVVRGGSSIENRNEAGEVQRAEKELEDARARQATAEKNLDIRDRDVKRLSDEVAKLTIQNTPGSSNGSGSKGGNEPKMSDAELKARINLINTEEGSLERLNAQLELQKVLLKELLEKDDGSNEFKLKVEEAKNALEKAQSEVSQYMIKNGEETLKKFNKTVEETDRNLIAGLELVVEQSAEGSTERLMAEIALQEMILAKMKRSEDETENEFRLRVQRQKNLIKGLRGDLESQGNRGDMEKVNKFVSVSNMLSSAVSELTRSFDNEALAAVGESISFLSSSISDVVSKIGEKDGKLDFSGATMSIYSAVLTTVVKIAQWMVKISKEEDEAQRKALEWQNTLKLAGMELKDFSSAFGVDKIAQMSNAVDVMVRAQDELEKRINMSSQGLADSKKWVGLNRETLAERYPELFNPDGSINVDMIDEVLANGELKDSEKAMLEYFKQLNDKVKEAADSVKEYISDTFGAMSDAAMDSIVNAVKTGARSWEDFRKAGSKAIEELGEQMLYDLFLAENFKGLQDNLTELYNNDTGEFDMEGVQALLDNFMTTMEGSVLPAATDFADRFAEAARSHGLDVWGGDTAKSASGAISTVTEQTASLVVGQMNAIRMNQVEMNSMMRQQLMVITNIKGDTAYLRSIDRRLASIEGRGNYGDRLYAN